jgi:transaldolase
VSRHAGCAYDNALTRFSECRAHAELDTLWPNVEDPATQHPFSFRTRHILETYQKLYQETGKEQPKVLSARWAPGFSELATFQAHVAHSFVNAKEVVANAELGVWGMTLPPALLKEMANTPDDGPVPSDPKPYHPYAKKGPVPARFAEMSTKDPLAGANWDGKLASTEIDYIANNGAALDKANKEDPVVGPRLQDALDIFVQADADVKAEIEKVLASI